VLKARLQSAESITSADGPMLINTHVARLEAYMLAFEEILLGYLYEHPQASHSTNDAS
jgi:hypothetical protein